MLVVPKRVEVDGVVNALLQVIAAHATTERANADFMIAAKEIDGSQSKLVVL